MMISDVVERVIASASPSADRGATARRWMARVPSEVRLGLVVKHTEDTADNREAEEDSQRRAIEEYEDIDQQPRHITPSRSTSHGSAGTRSLHCRRPEGRAQRLASHAVRLRPRLSGATGPAFRWRSTCLRTRCRRLRLAAYVFGVPLACSPFWIRRDQPRPAQDASRTRPMGAHVLQRAHD